ncbi:MAG: phosphatase PAP2 family protein [Bryobacteraceae bacterium]
MAEIVTERETVTPVRTGVMDWWPVDRLILGYFAAATAAEAAWWNRIPGAGWLILAHVLAVAGLWLAVRYPDSRTSVAFRHWYPLPYVAACYKEMAILIPAIRSSSADEVVAKLDLALWGVHPTVWLERFRSPLTAEMLQIIYAGFLPAVLLTAYVLWRRRRLADFRFYAFLIAIGFLASYAGYLLVPVRGPRFLLASLQSYPLEGLWLFDFLRSGLDQLESAHYDCFPSGHTELTLLAALGSGVVSRKLSIGMLVYAAGVMTATVYLRYHYTVDVFAGALLAALLWLTAPALYRWLGGKV